MLKYLKKNKFIVACFTLLALLYFYGNMEFYESAETCASPKDLNKPYLNSTDDIVLVRKDMAQLNNNISRFKYNGLDNWPKKGTGKGWWADSSAVADNLYIPPAKLVWPD